MVCHDRKTVAILVAAGSSRRFGRDKLWLPLGRRPVIAHTLIAFLRCQEVDSVILVIHPQKRTQFRKLCRSATFSRYSSRLTLVDGGTERQHSVWLGIQALPMESEIVLIHDGARCCVTPGLISETIAVARKHGAAIAAAPLTDTIKESQVANRKSQVSRITRTLDRSRLWAAQTPQTFRADLLRRAYERVMKRKLTVTDDAAAVEALGQPVYLVASDATNLKITRPADLLLAREILRRSKSL